MRLRILVPFLFLVLGLQAQDWEVRSYPADGFQASFPGQPKQSYAFKKTNNTPIRTNDFSSKTDGIAYSVGTSNNPELTKQLNQPGELLKYRQRMLAGLQLIEQSDREIALGTAHGFAFEAQGKSFHIHYRMYISGTRIYTLTVIQDPPSKMAADHEKFFSSFRILDQSIH